jgi:hypothetical protein
MALLFFTWGAGAPHLNPNEGPYDPSFFFFFFIYIFFNFLIIFYFYFLYIYLFIFF